ncbi:two-component system response regulator CreB [Agarilytica rhodophyticola]|uniref:two-component system response regulator CreB n=1 Tax=Agarilytica rhodophyticola TaxID=1737490 RepID=UPI000B344E67|nr:two-component system response regulator CreB [Agarilytica rhodophyticola]
MQKHTILIVDDEPTIAQTLEYALQCEGFFVETCQLGKDAIDLVYSNHNTSDNYALIVLDIGLPDISGIEVCKQIRKFSDIPVLFLTARDSEIDRIIGLEIGGDDYVTKPFSPREVATRVKVILKRYGFQRDSQQELSKLNKEQTLQIDLEKASVVFFGESLNLTRYEFLLLKTLAEHPERVFSRSRLMDIIWPESVASMERSIDTHIKTLRSKLREVNDQCDVIKTHRGLGYSLNRL